MTNGYELTEDNQALFRGLVTSLAPSCRDHPIRQATLILQVDWRLTGVLVQEAIVSSPSLLAIVDDLLELRHELISSVQSPVLQKYMWYSNNPVFQNRLPGVFSGTDEAFASRIDLARLRFIASLSSDDQGLLGTCRQLRTLMLLAGSGLLLEPFGAYQALPDFVSLTDDLCKASSTHLAILGALLLRHPESQLEADDEDGSFGPLVYLNRSIPDALIGATETLVQILNACANSSKILHTLLWDSRNLTLEMRRFIFHTLYPSSRDDAFLPFIHQGATLKQLLQAPTSSAASRRLFLHRFSMLTNGNFAEQAWLLAMMQNMRELREKGRFHFFFTILAADLKELMLHMLQGMFDFSAVYERLQADDVAGAKQALDPLFFELDENSVVPSFLKASGSAADLHQRLVVLLRSIAAEFCLMEVKIDRCSTIDQPDPSTPIDDAKLKAWLVAIEMLVDLGIGGHSMIMRLFDVKKSIAIANHPELRHRLIKALTGLLEADKTNNQLYSHICLVHSHLLLSQGPQSSNIDVSGCSAAVKACGLASLTRLYDRNVALLRWTYDSTPSLVDEAKLFSSLTLPAHEVFVNVDAPPGNSSLSDHPHHHFRVQSLMRHWLAKSQDDNLGYASKALSMLLVEEGRERRFSDQTFLRLFPSPLQLHRMLFESGRRSEALHAQFIDLIPHIRRCQTDHSSRARLLYRLYLPYGHLYPQLGALIRLKVDDRPSLDRLLTVISLGHVLDKWPTVLSQSLFELLKTTYPRVPKVPTIGLDAANVRDVLMRVSEDVLWDPWRYAPLDFGRVLTFHSWLQQAMKTSDIADDPTHPLAYYLMATNLHMYRHPSLGSLLTLTLTKYDVCSQVFGDVKTQAVIEQLQALTASVLNQWRLLRISSSISAPAPSASLSLSSVSPLHLHSGMGTLGTYFMAKLQVCGILFLEDWWMDDRFLGPDWWLALVMHRTFDSGAMILPHLLHNLNIVFGAELAVLTVEELALMQQLRLQLNYITQLHDVMSELASSPKEEPYSTLNATLVDDCYAFVDLSAMPPQVEAFWRALIPHSSAARDIVWTLNSINGLRRSQHHTRYISPAILAKLFILSKQVSS